MLAVWCKQIDQVLAQSKQMRKVGNPGVSGEGGRGGVARALELILTLVLPQFVFLQEESTVGPRKGAFWFRCQPPALLLKT